MNIKDLLNSKRVSLSFEVFPPKENAQICGVLSAVKRLSEQQPDFMSVTYGAGGGTSTNTAQIADYIENKLNVTALAHLTCVSSTPNDIAAITGELSQKGVKNILALRGDLPSNMQNMPPRHYKYAAQLIRDLKKTNDFCIGGACYPEGHIENPNKEDDIAYLKEKVDAGCDFLITQLFFDNNVLYNFLYRLFQNNINVPVIAGIMPVTNIKSIRKMTKLSGAALTPKYKAMLDRFEHSPKALAQAGIAYAIEQVIDLISNGVKGIHIYTMNKPEIAESIIAGVSHIIRGEQNK
ncbi:MAG: methylenetetrahydrofolate reductase [NAD(P)H] [Firmicutes bacterium]|nr:methylenetetrahydrofolate reductase [NAD(P)H] [Bacillota bacterium]